MSDIEKKAWAHVNGSEKMHQMQCPYSDCGRPFLYDARTADDFPNGKMGYAYIKQIPVPLKYNEIKEKLAAEIKNHGELYLKFLKLKSDLDSAQGKLKKAIAVFKEPYKCSRCEERTDAVWGRSCPAKESKTCNWEIAFDDILKELEST